jgi:hypothetical protein
MFVNSIYQKTFYPAHRPYQIVADTVFEYKRRIQEKQEKKGKWKRPFLKLWQRFMALGVRKTRMEREQEFQDRMRRASFDKEQADFDRRIRAHRVERTSAHNEGLFIGEGNKHRVQAWN